MIEREYLLMRGSRKMYTEQYVEKLNKDIEQFPQVFPVTKDMYITQSGVSKLVWKDRYAFKDIELKTLSVGDEVTLTVKEDPQFPARGLGIVKNIDYDEKKVLIEVDEEWRGPLAGTEEEDGLVTRSFSQIEKPLEIYYEQVAKRNAWGLAKVEETEEKRQEWFEKFYKELSSMNFVPAGRVMYGAGAEIDVTYFNCFVMPYMKDSREGIAEHRGKVMEIMSRGGGVGTNGSTLRPRNELARGVNGKSSGAVSWLNDLAELTNLVQQGGSRRGAQMIMLADWHPDIIEFIISKMQNPYILRFIIDTTQDEQIKTLAKEKLKFEPLSVLERKQLEMVRDLVAEKQRNNVEVSTEEQDAYDEAVKILSDGGHYSVHQPDFLSGANISVCLTHEFMQAVENNGDYTLRFPDVASYNEEEMAYYNENWHECGDVREWETEHNMRVKTYRKIKAKDLWDLINICATYSAEPGIFFIDNANDKTNAKAYGQKVVATNPCGEQPLAPYSVCNLAAVNLANMSSFETRELDVDKLVKTVEIGVRMQDNVISATPFFLEENTKQALGERRVGLGVMGLHDLLIKMGVKYGSEEGQKIVDQVFQIIAETAYKTSVELAKEKGSFPFLKGNNEQEELENRKKFINTGYMKEMKEEIRQAILEHGIRNSHLLTVAPTGSTGTFVGVSTGLEPYFAFKYYRSGRLGQFIEVNANIVDEFLAHFPEYTSDNLPDYFVSAMELSPEAHADTQCVIQRWVDSSLSKTVNAPKGYSVEEVQAVYERLWKGGAKGGTVYVDGSRDTQVLSLTKEDRSEQMDIFRDASSDGTATAVATEVEVDVETVTYGSEIGDTCPICRKGVVEEIGGCNTCTNCNTQLRCGV